jgi:DNA anti-recombination protein RmuC
MSQSGGFIYADSQRDKPVSSKEEEKDKQEHLEQIRDIILGPHKSVFESQFHALEASLKELRADMQKQKQDLAQDFSSGLAAVTQSLEQLRTTGNEHREELKGRTEQLAQSFRKEVENLHRALAESSSGLQGQLDEAYTKLEKALCQLKDQMYQDLDGRLLNLRESHMPRALMADLLFDLGTKIKDSAAAVKSDKPEQKKNSGRS